MRLIKMLGMVLVLAAVLATTPQAEAVVTPVAMPSKTFYLAGVRYYITLPTEAPVAAVAAFNAVPKPPGYRLTGVVKGSWYQIGSMAPYKGQLMAMGIGFTGVDGNGKRFDVAVNRGFPYPRKNGVLEPITARVVVYGPA